MIRTFYNNNELKIQKTNDYIEIPFELDFKKAMEGKSWFNSLEEVNKQVTDIMSKVVSSADNNESCFLIVLNGDFKYLKKTLGSEHTNFKHTIIGMAMAELITEEPADRERRLSTTYGVPQEVQEAEISLPIIINLINQKTKINKFNLALRDINKGRIVGVVFK